MLPCEPSVEERELGLLNAMHDAYGIRAVKFNQGMNAVTVEYEASHLTTGGIECTPRNAGMRPRNSVASAA